MFDVAVIGGGAAGMMCAVAAARSGASAVIIERNARLGRKLAITGKGRCNVTNNSDNETIMKNIPRNDRFLYSALSQFSAADTMDFFESLGVPLKTERGNRVFPVSDKAGDVVSALTSELERLGVGIIHEKAASLITEGSTCVGVKTARQSVMARAVVLCTGGKSYPVTGSDGFGYKLAEQAGHSIIKPVPSLSAMETAQNWTKRAAGLNLRNISMTVFDGEKKIYDDFGELLFTAYGVSGPTVLSASAYIPQMEQNRYTMRLDLKPALSQKQLDARILRDFAKQAGCPFGESLRALLPPQLIPVMVELSEIPQEKRVDEVSKAERKRFAELLKSLRLDITGFRPIEEAIITRGGVSIKEINPKTMESKLCKNLFFAGEIIDCDAYTGGFNLQIAFSTGYVGGINAAICGK